MTQVPSGQIEEAKPQVWFPDTSVPCYKLVYSLIRETMEHVPGSGVGTA